MEHADRQIEGNDRREVVYAGGENIPGEDLLEVFRALRGAVDEQDRGGGGDHIDDADQRFLRNPARPGAREREEEAAMSVKPSDRNRSRPLAWDGRA